MYAFSWIIDKFKTIKMCKDAIKFKTWLVEYIPKDLINSVV